MASEQNDSLRERMAARFNTTKDVYDVLKATAFRQKGKDAPEITDEQMEVLCLVALEYGLNPFLKEIYAYPDQGAVVPMVSVDGWIKVVNQHPKFAGMSFNYSPDMEKNLQGLKKPLNEWIECTIRHKDRAEPTVIREYSIECYKPPFVGKSQYNNGGTYEIAGPWQNTPRRMLRHRALIQTARVAFGITGLGDGESVESSVIDMGQAEEVSRESDDIMPRALENAPTQTADEFFGSNTVETPAEKVEVKQSTTAAPDFTSAPNRFARDTPAAAQASEKPQRARASRKPEDKAPPAGEASGQGAMFDERPTDQSEGEPPEEPASAAMLKVLQRKFDIAGKNEVDLKAKFGCGFDGVTKRNYGAIQAWVLGEA